MNAPNTSRTPTRFALFLVLTVFPLLAVSAPNTETQNTALKIVHVLDYIAVDYANVVEDGKVTNAEEYAEQQEFVVHLTTLVQQLPEVAGKSTLTQSAKQLAQAVHQLQPGVQVAALCSEMSARTIELFDVDVFPRVAPEPMAAATLFQDNCAMCHGVEGFGNGAQAAGLQPAPANFHEHERQQHRSIFSLYNTISLGVEGTAMPAFTQFDAQQRWQLAFYVSNFFASDAERAAGEAALNTANAQPLISNLKQLTQSTPAQIAAQFGDKGLAELAYLRSAPEYLQTHARSPIRIAKDHLHAALSAMKKGEQATAYEHALAAYLDGFELTEARLNASAPELRTEIENAMLAYRDRIKRGDTVANVESSNVALIGLLNRAQEKLSDDQLSSSVNFFSAFLIILREGIEAILILAAISAVLIKTGRPEMMRYLHLGWISALLLGGLTWFIAGQFLDISGSSREITEGIAALIAAVMLIYVGFWLHKQSYAMQWQTFIRDKVSKSLGDSAMIGMAVVAFIAVYREVFESILFVHTLWLQTSGEGHTQVMSGLISAAVLLVILAWVMFRFSVRLPLKLFFRANSILLYVLAIIFAGKGIAALQEAGKLRIDPVNFFQIDALGIFPNLESLGLQAGLIAIAIFLYSYSRNKEKKMLATP